MYMLGAKRGFGQSMDGTAQRVDPRFVQQSMDCQLIPWIAQTEGRKAWIQAIYVHVYVPRFLGIYAFYKTRYAI